MIVIGTTLAAFAMDDPETYQSWLINAEAIAASHDEGVIFFAALELDARGLEPFFPLLARMDDLPSDYWTFHLDDGRAAVTSNNRVRHICLGQNLCTDYALSEGASHLLFLAADLEPPADVLPKLLEMDHPLVGMEIPTYSLSGPEPQSLLVARGPLYPDFPVQEHMASAAGVMIRRDLLRSLRWRWDLDAGMTDDPCLHHDALHLHGVPTYVRKDCVGIHHPEYLPPVEQRGHDLTVHR